MQLNVNNQEDNFSSYYLKPYLADLAIAIAFGVGYYIFKKLKWTDDKKSEIQMDVKQISQTKVDKWKMANSIQKFHSLILSNVSNDTSAFQILELMKENNVYPDKSTYNCLLSMIIRNGNEEEEEKLMNEMLNPLSPITPDIITFNILIKNIVRKIVSIKHNSSKVLELKNKITHLQSIIKELSLNYDLVTYNTLIDAFIEADDFNQALGIYEQMLLNSKSSEILESEISFDNGIPSNILKPDAYTYTTLIKGLKNQSDSFSKILEIFKIIEEEDLNDEYVTNSVLDACVKYNQIAKAEEILSISEKKGIKLSVITYSILVKGYCNENKLKEALELLNKMKLKSIKPNEVVYDCIMNCTIRNNNINAMQKVYNLMISEGLFPNSHLLLTLIRGFSKAKYYDLIISLYDSIPLESRSSLDLIFYNCLIDSLIDSKNIEKINEIFLYLESHETLKPNIMTLSTILKAYCKLGQDIKAEELYNKIKLQEELQLDEIFFNTYADHFARQKNIQKTLEILEDMKKLNIIRSTIIYSIIIRMYGMCNMDIKSIEVYREMRKTSFRTTLVTETTVMQMFIKQKKLEEAIEIFKEMKSNKDIKIDNVTYNFIINGCSFNKRLEDAVRLLIQSIDEGYVLDENTYCNVLTYLVENKFMKANVRCQYTKELLNKIKEKNINIKYEVYSKSMKVIYDNTNQSNNGFIRRK